MSQPVAPPSSTPSGPSPTAGVQGGAPVEAASPAAPPTRSADAVAGSCPREIGGRDGPEPTRFGDWEQGGRCIDF